MLMKKPAIIFTITLIAVFLITSGLACKRKSPTADTQEGELGTIPGIEKQELEKKELAAVVNGTEITKDEFFQKLRAYIQTSKSQLEKAGRGQRDDETEEEFVQRMISLIIPTPLGKNILESMISGILIEQKAQEQNITVATEEIDKKVDEIKEQSRVEFGQYLSESGMTIEDLRQQVQSKILMDKIVAKSVTVTEKDIRDHFERYKDNFAKPEEIKASHILLRTEIEAEVILSQLKAGADFSELARKESTDPATKEKSGDLGFFPRGKMTPNFEQAAFALKAGEISEVIQTPYGYHIIKVEEKKPAQEPNFELEREEIKKTLVQQKTWTLESNFLQNLRKEAEIEILLPELRD